MEGQGGAAAVSEGEADDGVEGMSNLGGTGPYFRRVWSCHKDTRRDLSDWLGLL